MALPTASTPGYTLFRGRVACVCLAKWLGVYERLLLARNLIKVSIDPWQLTGGAAASGGTHTQGGVFDLLYQTSAAHVAVAREMGAPATWARTVSQGFSKAHSHGVLSGCPHNAPARYQITAQRNGYNGLGVATSGQYAGQWGYGARDNHPDPQTYRTWEQGIAWAEVEIARLNPAPPPPPLPPVVAPVPPKPAPPEEPDMQFSDIIPGTNPPLTVGQALVRGAHAYGQIVSGGWVQRALGDHGTQLNKQAAALGAIADDVDNIPETVKAVLQEAAVQVDVNVTYPQAPETPTA